jgi:PIN domain nuclease of toxin-antitoxin system
VTVFDASALLAYLRDEPGAALVRERLIAGGMCSAANWSEVAQKVRGAGADWALGRALLLSFPLIVDPVSVDDAERAAELWAEAADLSLADRLCLALAERRETTALTADSAWRRHPRAELIR